jgi:hypothetical protein
MGGDYTFTAWINPLQFLEVDEPWASLKSKELNLEDVINFLCTPGLDSGLDSIVARYKEISKEQNRIFAAPAEERILEKLIWPLRHAKAGYMTGNYLGTISLCGMVAEMVAILFFEMSSFHINNRAMEVQDQAALFGSSFEKLSQERRVKVLRAFDMIDSQIEAAFDVIRTTRRKYLHLWSQDHEKLPNDAVVMYDKAVYIVSRVIGQNVIEGKIQLNPALVQYLRKQGMYEINEH